MPDTKPVLKSYKFDLGNSSTGPIGAVIRVMAENKEQAVERVEEFMSSYNDYTEVEAHGLPYIEYCTVYFGEVSTKDIVEDETKDVAPEDYPDQEGDGAQVEDTQPISPGSSV